MSQRYRFEHMKRAPQNQKKDLILSDCCLQTCKHAPALCSCASVRFLVSSTLVLASTHAIQQAFIFRIQKARVTASSMHCEITQLRQQSNYGECMGPQPKSVQKVAVMCNSVIRQSLSTGAANIPRCRGLHAHAILHCLWICVMRSVWPASIMPRMIETDVVLLLEPNT